MSSSKPSKCNGTGGSKVVALPSMTHSLSHLPNMHTVDPKCLHYGGLGASKEASQAKLQQTLQRRDPTSTTTYGGSQTQPVFRPLPTRKSGNTGDDDDYLMMNKGRKKPA